MSQPPSTIFTPQTSSGCLARAATSTQPSCSPTLQTSCASGCSSASAGVSSFFRSIMKQRPRVVAFWLFLPKKPELDPVSLSTICLNKQGLSTMESYCYNGDDRSFCLAAGCGDHHHLVSRCQTQLGASEIKCIVPAALHFPRGSMKHPWEDGMAAHRQTKTTTKIVIIMVQIIIIVNKSPLSVPCSTSQACGAA